MSESSTSTKEAGSERAGRVIINTFDKVFLDAGYPWVPDVDGRAAKQITAIINQETNLPALLESRKQLLEACEMVLSILCDKELCGHFLPEEIRQVIEPALAKAKEVTP